MAEEKAKEEQAKRQVEYAKQQEAQREAARIAEEKLPEVMKKLTEVRTKNYDTVDQCVAETFQALQQQAEVMPKLQDLIKQQMDPVYLKEQCQQKLEFFMDLGKSAEEAVQRMQGFPGKLLLLLAANHASWCMAAEFRLSRSSPSIR